MNKLYSLVFSVFICLSQIVNAIDFNQTLSKNSGYLTFKEIDFPVEILNYPSVINKNWRATFNETKVDRVFMHTFSEKIKAGCQVSNARLEVDVTNLASTRNNDTVGFVDRGAVLFTTNIWNKNEEKRKMKKLSFDLANLPKVGSIIDTLQDGYFSFYIQDDTAVNSVKLFRTLSGGACER